MPKLVYDVRDDILFEQRGMRNLYWLDDLGAVPLTELDPDDEAFLFAGARSIEDYRKLTADYPGLRDSPEARQPLLELDSVLNRIGNASDRIGAPTTWTWHYDMPIPMGIRYPVFVRTAKSSWKLGGAISKANCEDEFRSESFELRRAFGFDQAILAREWLDIISVGQYAHGSVPMEIRTWIVDGKPFAWSFHHLQHIRDSELFPLSNDDIKTLISLASQITCFESRLVCADFVKTIDGTWRFLEAGPGSCAGTAHEFVFKSVAAKLAQQEFFDPKCQPDKFGQRFGLI